MGSIHCLYAKCTLQSVGSHGCTLSVLSNVLVAMYVC